jgi:hypothetical protein
VQMHKTWTGGSRSGHVSKLANGDSERSTMLDRARRCLRPKPARSP